MTGIKSITAIYYDENKIHPEDNGHSRHLWIEYCNGDHYAYASVLKNRTDLISDDLYDLRVQHGYKDAELCGLGESQCIHMEMWHDKNPMIFIWDWLSYRPTVAEFDGIEEGIHKFSVNTDY